MSFIAKIPYVKLFFCFEDHFVVKFRPLVTFSVKFYVSLLQKLPKIKVI